MHCCVQKKLRLTKQLEKKSEERDRKWLEEMVEEVDRELEYCSDKAQIHLGEIEVTEVSLDALEDVRYERKGEFMSQTKDFFVDS